jgi:LPS export ABC transporter protein LptC
MAVDSVTELFSDSGIISYKLIADTWLFFEKSKDPYWYFPKGLYVEQFDSLFHVQVTIKADTAWNYRLRKLWKLKGHVFVRNISNETFESEELYWDERIGKVYSDVHIKIIRPDKMNMSGIGFHSNQQMTAYSIRRPDDTEVYVEEGENEE